MKSTTKALCKLCLNNSNTIYYKIIGEPCLIYSLIHKILSYTKYYREVWQ